MKKNIKKIIIICVLIILVFILLSISIYFYSLTSVTKESDKVTFTVASGTSASEIINNLYADNIIKSKIATIIYVKLHNSVILAGTYELDRNYSTQEIMKMLCNGEVIDNTYTITFVEGKRLNHYVSQISETFGYSETEILEVIGDVDYLNELINKYEFLDTEILNTSIYYPLEGYLFPSTYEFYKDASIKDIIEKMLDKTGSVLDDYMDKIAESTYSVHEILTIASIVENETMYDEDRSVVSQVIYERLKLNMNLGMDVTAYYGARKELTENLTTVDLNSENAYNTRNTSFKGLPVSPICNPSSKSIEAALNPSDTNYVYFYAEVSTGKLYFAETYQEFLNLKKLYS